MLPGVVALELVLARTDRVAVCVSRLAAYPTGFEFELVTMSAPGQDELELDPMMFGHHHHRASRRGSEKGLPPELLRIGVEFADATKATNIAGFHHDQEPPAGPVMHPGGGGGGGRSWHQTQWVWPIPPPGPLNFVCEWPAADIPLTRSKIDAQTILDATTRARVIFPDQPSAQGTTGSSWTSYAPLTSTSKPKPQPHSE